MNKTCEIWGSGPDSGFLAGLLAEAGWTVKWVRPPERHARLRPLKLRRFEEAQLTRLLLRYGLNKRKFGSALNLQNYYDPEVLGTTFLELAERLQIEISNVSELPPLSKTEDRLVIVNEDPEHLGHWGSSAFSTFREATHSWVSELWFPEGRLSNYFSTQTLALGDVLLFLDPHPQRGYVLSLYSDSLSNNDRTLQSLLSYKSRLPLFWRSLSLMNHRSRRVDKPLAVGGQELAASGVFALGQSLGKLYEFSNADTTDYFNQVLALFSRLQRSRDNALSQFVLAEDWRFEARRSVEKALRRGRVWKSLLSSHTTAQICIPMMKKLPEPLRQLLQSPI